MKFTNICFFLGLIALASALKIKTQNSDFADVERSYRVKASIFKFAIDDEIVAIHINDRQQDFQFPLSEVRTKEAVHVQKVYLVPGDTLKITARDLIKGRAWLIGTLQYFDLDGNEHIIQTNSEWKCNGIQAIENGVRDTNPLVKEHITAIDSVAKYIWVGGVSVLKKDIICEYTIPRCF